MQKKLFSTILCCMLYYIAPAQYAVSPGAMRLSKTQSGHYAFNTLCNHKLLTSVMIESGIHAALIDSSYYFSHKQELGVKVLPIDTKIMNGTINLGGTIYRITHSGKGKIPMGAITYEGEILILANYENNTPITIPIQKLKHSYDWNSHIVMLDIKGGEIRMLTHKELKSWQGIRYKINRNTYKRMPAIKTTISFTFNGVKSELEGNFNIDLGNPMLLYLLGNRPKVTELFETNQQITPIPIAYDPDGKISIQAFVPNQCDILGNSFTKPTICVTNKFKRFSSEGLIGLGFLERHIVAFDFDNNYLYIKE